MDHHFRFPKAIQRGRIIFFVLTILAGAFLFLIETTGWLIFFFLIWFSFLLWVINSINYAYQTIVFTEKHLVRKTWLSSRQVAYQDVYYIRSKPTSSIGVTLITLKGPIHIPSKLDRYSELLKILEQRVPEMLTSSIIQHPLPFKVSGSRSILIILLFTGLVFTAIGVAGMIALFTGDPGSGIIGAIFGGIGLLFFYVILTQPRYFLFTKTEIVQANYLKRRKYDAEQIEMVHQETRQIKTKNGTRTVYNAVFNFKNGHQLRVSSGDIAYPFAEMIEILQWNYNPQAQPNIPWRKQARKIPYKKFNSYANREFEWYFTGESSVKVNNVAEICDWLTACEYRYDKNLFMEAEFWQHPVTFEQIRKGDCEDHALWAWRKLVNLGFKAEFVVGKMKDGGGHAWVFFEQNGHHYLLEATNKRGSIVRPIEKAKGDYIPEYGVDQHLTTFLYQPK